MLKVPRMYYYMWSDSAVCTLACPSGNSDPQSFAEQKICHMGQCKGECVLNHFCFCFAMDIATSGSKFKAQQFVKAATVSTTSNKQKYVIRNAPTYLLFSCW